MKYLGIYHDYNLPNINLPRLIEYVNNIELLSSYNAENPFYIEQIAVLLDSNENYSAYDVFECGAYFTTEVEAKAFARTFAENLIKYRQVFTNYYRQELTKYHNYRVRNN